MEGAFKLRAPHPAPNDEALAFLTAMAEEVVDTPAALVALVGEAAFKLKRAVDFGFLDFSTAERRRWAAEREVVFNAAAAPGLYRGVREVRRRSDGRLSLEDGAPTGEVVVEMRRFASDAVLAAAPERLDDDLAEALGREIARRHAAEAPEAGAGGTAALGYTVRSNAQVFEGMRRLLGEPAVARVVDGTAAAFERLAPVLEARAAAGWGRRCHGDLHLGNILVEDGRDPVLFDCIEFNDRLSRIDVLYDVAFTLMDLLHRGRADGASRVLSAWYDEAQREPGDAAMGFEVLPLFLSVRAAVRAHVVAAAGRIEAARAYLAAAEAHLSPPPPSLLAVGGLSGSGKSTYARRIAPERGAVVLRSDEVRKRLWRVGSREPLPAEAYAAGESERVYSRMLAEASVLLGGGCSVVLDAVFLQLEERSAAKRLAADRGVAFEGVWLDAPPDMLRARVEARRGDASDADARVVDEQLSRDPGPMDWAVVSAC